MDLATLFSELSLWQAPLVVGTSCGLVCGYLGPWAYFKRVSFLALTLTQVAALGYLLGNLLAFHISSGAHGGESLHWPGPVGAYTLALLWGGFMARSEIRKKQLSEQALAMGFVVCFAMIIFIGDVFPQLGHALNQVLYGSPLAVTSAEVAPMLLMLFSCALILLFYHQKLLYVVMDREYESLMGTKVTLSLALLYGMLCLVLVTGTLAIGALPIFSFGLFPTLTAKNFARGHRSLFFWSAFLGALSYALGFFLSYAWDLASGASIALAPFLLYGLTSIYSFLKGKVFFIIKRGNA